MSAEEPGEPSHNPQLGFDIHDKLKSSEAKRRNGAKAVKGPGVAELSKNESIALFYATCLACKEQQENCEVSWKKCVEIAKVMQF